MNRTCIVCKTKYHYCSNCCEDAFIDKIASMGYCSIECCKRSGMYIYAEDAIHKVIEACRKAGVIESLVAMIDLPDVLLNYIIRDLLLKMVEKHKEWERVIKL